MDSPQTRFALALKNTSRAWRVAFERRLKCRGLSHARWLAVAAVATAEKPPSQSELAQFLGVERATMVPMLDRLVVAGFVQRKCSDEDRRVKRVIITAAGHELYRQIEIEVEFMRRELLAPIHQDELLIAIEILESVQRIAESP